MRFPPHGESFLDSDCLFQLPYSRSYVLMSYCYKHLPGVTFRVPHGSFVATCELKSYSPSSAQGFTFPTVNWDFWVKPHTLNCLGSVVRLRTRAVLRVFATSCISLQRCCAASHANPLKGMGIQEQLSITSIVRSQLSAAVAKRLAVYRTS
jgi:hypothetical protein